MNARVCLLIAVVSFGSWAWSTEKKLVLTEPMQHMRDGNSCTLCHRSSNQIQLVLLDGSAPENVATLCGQCHGPKFREWREGLHGKRTGSWRDAHERKVETCTFCHNPHRPRFPTMRAQAAPQAPRLVIPKIEEDVHHER